MRYLIIVSFVILAVNVKASVESSLKNNLLNFGANNISIEGGGFSVVIIENDILKEIKPIGVPFIEIVERLTPIGFGLQKIYTWETHKGYQIRLKVSSMGTDIIGLSAEFINGTLHPVYLKAFHLINTPESGFNVVGEPSEWMLATTDVEARRWGVLDEDIPTEKELKEAKAYSRKYLLSGGDEEKINNRKWRGYYDDMTLYSKEGEGVSMAAVDTISDVFFDVKVEGTKMKLEIRSDMSEVLVESGEERISDEVLFMFKPWAEAQQLRNKWIAEVTGAKLTKKPVYGWCSWYRSKSRVNEQEIFDITAYSKKNHNKIPMEVIQIDDGWQIAKYRWTENEKFESGLETLADSIIAAGMVPGIWLSPVQVELIKSELDETRRPLPIEWYVNFKTGNPDAEKLDPSHPEAAKYMTKSLQYCYEKGYRYFKLDFSKIPFEAKRFYNSKLTRLQAQRELFRLYREAIGVESYLLACGICDQRTLAPYVDADRIGTDCIPTGGFAKALAADNKPGNIHGLWFPVVSMANKCYENGVLAHADPDVTYLAHTEKSRPKQLLTYNSYIGIFGGLTMTSDKMYLPEFDQIDNIRIMEVMYPVSNIKGHSFSGGWDMYGKEFGYEVLREYGNSVNLILWNPEHNGTANLTMSHVPITNIGSKFHAWSFWDEKYKGVIDNSYTAIDIPRYEHELLKLTAISDIPTIVGSNLHISMGATEISSIRFEENNMVIELDANAGARNGKLFIYSEEKLANAQSTNSDAFIVKQDNNLYVVTLLDRIRDKAEIISIEIGGDDAPLESTIVESKKIKEDYTKGSFSKSWLTSW